MKGSSKNKKERDLERIKQWINDDLIPIDDAHLYFTSLNNDVIKAIYKHKKQFKIKHLFLIKNFKKYIIISKFETWLKERPEHKQKIETLKENCPAGFKKIYSVYQFDWFKYAKIYSKLQYLSLEYDSKIFNNVNPYRVLKLCYLRDKKGNKIHLGDEPHIFRYAIYHRILNEIAEFLTIAYELEQNKDVLNYLTKRTNIVVYNTDEEQKDDKEKDILCAEFQDLKNKPFDIRFKVHCRLLKGLYKGLEIEEAVEEARKILV